MKLIKCLFLCKKRVDSYGISVGLINSSAFVVNTLNENNIEAKLELITDSNCIDREIHKFKPSHVIIEALWVSAEKFKVLLKLHPKVKFIVRIHSKIPFLAQEGMAIEYLKEYKEVQKHHFNFHVSANSIELTKTLITIFKVGGVYLPNIYNPKLECLLPALKEHWSIDIGCFGALRQLKNSLQQAVAAIEIADRLNKTLFFHINGNRVEDKTDSVLKNIRALFKNSEKHFLVEHNWCNHKDFLSVVSSMSLGLQVSYSETFNIVAADFVGCKVPLVVSAEIDWLPKKIQANPNSCQDIVDKALYALKQGTSDNSKALKKYNKDSIKTWLTHLA